MKSPTVVVIACALVGLVFAVVLPPPLSLICAAFVSAFIGWGIAKADWKGRVR